MSLDPGQVLSDVDEGSARLEKAADQLTDAIQKFEELENERQMALAVSISEVYHKALADGERPPAEDIRAAIALKDVDPQLQADWAAAKAHKEALSARFRALTASVSARQSLLKALTHT